MQHPIVVNVSSIFGLDGVQSSVTYSATKHAVIGIGKCLSMKEHFMATGVRIITICPGAADTPLLSTFRTLPGRYEDISKTLLPGLHVQQ